MTTLRYAIMLEGDTLPRWQHAALEQLLEFSAAQPVLIIENTGSATAERGPRSTLERRVFGRCKAEDHLALPLQLEKLPRHRCTKVGDELPADSVTMLRAQGFDFILRFGFGILRGGVLSAARFGVWSFHLGQLTRFSGPAPFFWEMLNRERVVHVVLQRLSNIVGGGTLLYEGSVRTIPESLADTRNLALSACRDFLVKACRDVLAGFPPGREVAPQTVERQPWPSGFDTLRYLLHNARARISAKLDYFFRHEQWGVGVIDQPIESLLNESLCPPAQWIDNPDRERFIADPAGVVEADGYGVFVEDLEQREYKGKVTYYKYQPEQGFTGPVDVLEESVHLSYPYLIEHEGIHYCIPEMSAANEVALYQITDYPYGWKRVATLLRDFAGLDSTVFQFEDRWWMFSTTRVASGAYSLVAFYADELFGPWHPHARNPLSMDIATSRPGGKPFIADGKLIRPAQDCSRTYGGALALMHVIQLTPNDFSEERICVVEPRPNSPYNDGFHTVFPLGANKTLVDGKRRILIPYLLKKALRLA